MVGAMRAHAGTAATRPVAHAPRRAAARARPCAGATWYLHGAGGTRGRVRGSCGAGAGPAGARRDVVATASAQELATTPTAFDEIAKGMDRRYVMISGKGGVGKTSMAASLGVRLAAEGHVVLVVSTDPAHSLSDSLAQDVSGGQPVALEGTDLSIWGMEIDPEQAKQEFKEYYASGGGKENIGDFMSSVGLQGLMESLTDLRLSELLDTPPPGLDESVAIAKVVQFVESQEYAKFTRIVFDTAPTGHTLRLLSLPDFVDKSLGKIIRLRKRLAQASGAVRAIFGQERQSDEAVQKLEELQRRVLVVRDLFRNADLSEFVIATVPTLMAANESRRLLKELRAENIPCRRLIVNQVVGETNQGAFLKQRLGDQKRAMKRFETDPALAALQRIDVDLMDVEVRGIPALMYLSSLVWTPDNGYTESDVSDAESGDETALSSELTDGRRFFMFGGKGGVGKTSMAASLGAKMAADGLPTLIVSTDPAHSLSDSLDQDVSGGKPVRVDSPMGDIPLYGMEIDVAAAREELKAIGKEGSFSRFLSNMGLGGLGEQLKDLNLSELLETAPPGVDEAVAISKVVALLRSPDYAHFKRVVFDTAPTGHTLRLLSFPDFLDKSVGKILTLRKRILDAVGGLGGVLGGVLGGGGNGDGQQTARREVEGALEKLETLRARMEEARALFRDPKRTEFVIVAIPTEMAAAESARLATALKAEGVPVRRVVVNQQVPLSATDKFLNMRIKDQAHALGVFRGDPELSKLQRIEAPMVDLEVRGLGALQYFGGIVWKSGRGA
ncbi:unnamed protein product [Pedinophyceae sp. YPF-701]|nr:unnamed protein product [Pedinophyceae sp. YPF-701]